MYFCYYKQFLWFLPIKSSLSSVCLSQTAVRHHVKPFLLFIFHFRQQVFLLVRTARNINSCCINNVDSSYLADFTPLRITWLCLNNSLHACKYTPMKKHYFRNTHSSQPKQKWQYCFKQTLNWGDTDFLEPPRQQHLLGLRHSGQNRPANGRLSGWQEGSRCCLYWLLQGFWHCLP